MQLFQSMLIGCIYHQAQYITFWNILMLHILFKVGTISTGAWPKQLLHEQSMDYIFLLKKLDIMQSCLMHLMHFGQVTHCVEYTTCEVVTQLTL